MSPHSRLVDISEKWLLKTVGCGFVLRELRHGTGSLEIPDVLGIKAGMGVPHGSILVECKVSRADFLADAKKGFRLRPESGVGAFRFYLSPACVINPEDLPERWGLVWVDGKGRAEQIVGPQGNIWTHSGIDFHFSERDLAAEWGLMASALRRLVR
jgi:hypothetical protein